MMFEHEGLMLLLYDSIVLLCYYQFTEGKFYVNCSNKTNKGVKTILWVFFFLNFSDKSGIFGRLVIILKLFNYSRTVCPGISITV